MKIKFIPNKPTKYNQLLKPEPAIKKLPDWYKAKSPFIGDDKKPKAFANVTKNLTVKWCNPFGDALGSGYFILLDNDVQITIENGEQEFVWLRGGNEFISTHSKDQVASDLIPEGYSAQPYKFLNNWGIQTPAGYSVLFTHPMNRTELPFLTLSGVVDTDEYNQPVNFPFVIKSNFEGIIKAGTPIVQVVPFRREKWTATIEEFDAEKSAAEQSTFSRTIHRPYKTGFWKRKEYK